MNDSSILGSSILITGARVYGHGGEVHQPPVADVLIEKGSISSVGESARPRASTMTGVETLDARGRLMLPGFVNAHFHSYDLLAKGMFEEVPLDIWRHYTGRMGAHRPKEEVRLRTLLGAVECLRNGITTVQDMSILAPYDPEIVDVILDAYRCAGLRTVFSVSIRDISDADTIPFVRELFSPELQKLAGDRGADAREVMAFARELIEHRPAGDILHWALSPSAPHRCTPAMLEMIAELADSRDLPVYTHLYEAKGHAVHARQRYAADGGSLVRYLDRFGLLGPRLTVAHGLWSRREELELLAARGAHVVVNVMSNFKLKDGVPPINEFRRAGVGMAFGCDCFSCSDAQNLFQSMKLCCLLAAGESPERGLLSAEQAIGIATAGGAATAGLGETLGSIRPGMKADLVLLDLGDPSFVPFNSAARQVVFSETGRAVETVIVEGRVVVRDRRMTTVDETALQRELAAIMPAYRAELDAAVKAIAPLARAFEEQARRVDAEDVGLDRFL
jgi:5-methylthioadenosine/S-adenosylhomocysteine deaminase